MKTKNRSLLVLSLLICCCCSLHAVPSEPTAPPSVTDPTTPKELLLTLDDRSTTQNITIDINDSQKSQQVVFQLPIVDIGATWTYTISNADYSNNDVTLTPLSVNLDKVIYAGFNKIEKTIMWNHYFELTCLPLTSGTASVTFFYVDELHEVSASYNFTINCVVAPSTDLPTPINPPTKTPNTPNTPNLPQTP